MPAPRNEGIVCGGPSRLVGFLAILLGCVGIVLSMAVYWIARIIPALRMKMPASKDPRSRPSHLSRRAISSPAVCRASSKSPKRVSFSIDEADEQTDDTQSAATNLESNGSTSASPRSSFSSGCSGDTSRSSFSFSSSKSSGDPFSSSSSGTSTLAGLFSSDRPSPIRIPNILKPKRLRSGSESSAASASSVSDAGSPTRTRRTASSASATTIRPPMSSKSSSRVTVTREELRPRPRSPRSQSIINERATRLKRVSEESGELFYSGFENPFKFRKRRSSCTDTSGAKSRKRLSDKVQNLFNSGSNDQNNEDSTCTTSDAASASSSDASKASVRRSKARSLMEKFVPSGPLPRTKSQGSAEELSLS